MVHVHSTMVVVVYVYVRTYEDIVLRDVMQALVRMQIYMLADIVVAVPAVDLAVEAVV